MAQRTPNVNNVGGSIPTFIGGVSQQGANLRLTNQCELQENFHATAADGLTKRPNTELQKVLGAITGPTGYFTHKIYRDANEKYIVFVTTDATNPIRVFALDGTEQTVRYGHLDADLNFTADNNVKAYLTGGGITDARNQIKAVSIADYTILVNTQMTVAKDSAVFGSMIDGCYVYFKSRHNGEIAITCTWKESGVNQSQTWSYGSTDNESDTTGLAAWFVANAPAGLTAKFYITQANSVIHIYPKGGVGVDAFSLNVKTQDGWGGQDLIPIVQQEIDEIGKLPAHMPTSADIKIGGDREIQQDDYWLRYDESRRRWYESKQPGLQYKLDEDTMPHRLVRTAAGQFTFAPILWTERTVGDDDTNSWPSFVGNKLNSVAFHKNRLWVFSKDNAIGSKAGAFFDFFKSTVMEVLDDDPIDVAASSEQVNHIRSAQPFDKGLLLLSDEAQFALTSGDQIFSPKTVAADGTTNFSVGDADSVKLGADVYFISPKEQYLTVRDYGIQPDTLIQDAPNVTAHVPKYIPKGDVLLTGCNQLDMLILWTSANPKTLFVHQFLWEDKNKVQMAWYKWTYESDIYGIHTFGTALYIIFYDATNGFRLEKCSLENIPYGSEPFRYHIDSMMELTNGVYGGVNTTFTLPRNVGDGSGWAVIDASDQSELATGFTLSNTTLTLTGDKSAGRYFVGRNYTARYRFSEFYLRDAGSQRAYINGKLSIRTLTLSFKDTGYFKVEVTPFSRDTLTEELSDQMSGIRVGESVIGAVSLLTGEKSFMVGADSKQTLVDIVSDSYLPCQLMSGVWEGVYTYRSRIS
jgi:hypothetical protein